MDNVCFLLHIQMFPIIFQSPIPASAGSVFQFHTANPNVNASLSHVPPRLHYTAIASAVIKIVHCISNVRRVCVCDVQQYT